jgi:hypothetical protein
MRHGGKLVAGDSDALRELGAHTMYDIETDLDAMVEKDILVKIESTRSTYYEVSATVQIAYQDLSS